MDWREIIERLEKELGMQGRRSGLAKELGVNSSIISGIKSGKSKNPGSNIALLLINKLNVNPKWLETGNEPIFLKRLGNEPFDDQNGRQKDRNLTFYRPKRPVKGQEPNLEPANESNNKVRFQSQSTKDAVANTIESLILESTAEMREQIDETFAEHNARLEKLESVMRRYEAQQSDRQPDETGDNAIIYLEKVYSDGNDIIAAEPMALYGAAHTAETVSLPLALNLAAGIPIEACDVNETYRVPKKLVKKGRQYCVAKIKGTSMTDAGIKDGDFVLLEYTDEPVSGTIMVVKYGDNTTLKRLHEREDGGWELRYEDGSGAKIELKEGCWEVKGKMIRVV